MSRLRSAPAVFRTPPVFWETTFFSIFINIHLKLDWSYATTAPYATKKKFQQTVKQQKKEVE
ncbi:hypothetical protein CANDROIZ_510001 [Candidatus Roizmanbacteria bacterium]|nr:hypothetical protein CANDROIZ_510001 [Candidatus Roizmanbacteria bacterium]